METNRNYFSWSQYSLFISSTISFYKRYTLGEDKLFLPAFDKGKEFADYRETGQVPHYVMDPLLVPVSKTIPYLDTPEKEVRVQLGELELLAFIDECQEDLTEFAEFKTGVDPWDQIKVDNHEQLPFYAVCIYLLSGEKIIPKCKLYWIETQEVEVLGEKKLMYTGNVEIFEREFDEDEIVAMASRILSTYQEILDYVHEEIDLEQEFDEDIVGRYIQIQEEQVKLQAEADLIKLNVLDIINSYGSKYASTSKGRFSISKRKTKHFTSAFYKKEFEFKTILNKMKNKEIDENKVEYTESESLLFKAVKQK